MTTAALSTGVPPSNRGRAIRINDSSLVFAPCYGRVVVIEKVMENGYLQGEMLEISCPTWCEKMIKYYYCPIKVDKR